MSKGFVTIPIFIIIAASVVIALAFIAGGLYYYGNFLASACWKNTLDSVGELRDAITQGKDYHELVLGPLCTLRVELTGNKERCGQLCNLDEFTGDRMDCFERCTACSAVPEAGSFIIAIPKPPSGIFETITDSLSGSTESIRSAFFDEVYCRASREYAFANELVGGSALVPEEDRHVFCLKIGRQPTTGIDDVFIEVERITDSPGGCGYG